MKWYSSFGDTNLQRFERLIRECESQYEKVNVEKNGQQTELRSEMSALCKHEGLNEVNVNVWASSQKRENPRFPHPNFPLRKFGVKEEEGEGGKIPPQ